MKWLLKISFIYYYSWSVLNTWQYPIKNHYVYRQEYSQALSIRKWLIVNYLYQHRRKKRFTLMIMIFSLPTDAYIYYDVCSTTFQALYYNVVIPFNPHIGQNIFTSYLSIFYRRPAMVPLMKRLKILNLAMLKSIRLKRLPAQKLISMVKG